ncbi:MAG: sulfatase-like hydrolase/transferase, partial [Planctomycetaceae bacterium]|nr:sulfatase-like hydrolase/transferase [Planctomycetaceae bacterium]
SGKATWRDRPTPETPFFHMRTTGVSHESSLHFTQKQMQQQKTITDPSAVSVPPYFPDTPTFRYTLARYHDRMREIDNQVTGIVDELRDDGVLDNTILFYFGDHGGVLPRSKGYLYETGLHVPLVVWLPEKWKHLAPYKAGSRPQGFVEFVDFGPTVLQLAGVETPQTMDGTPFLGKGISAEEVESRNEAFGYADRFDEKYEQVRSLRQGRFKYIRSFQPYYPDSLQNNYRYKMLAYEEWRELFQAGKLNEVQSAFFESKTIEMLFDVEADPHEVTNLAYHPDHQQTLLAMRSQLRQRLSDIHDLSMYPESALVDEFLPDAVGYGETHRDEIRQLLDVADLELDAPNEAKMNELQAALRSQDRWQRYWAVTACACGGSEIESLKDDLLPLLNDPEPTVRIRAAECFVHWGEEQGKAALLDVLKTSDSSTVALIALNSVVYLRDHVGIKFEPSEIVVKARGGEVARRLEYLGVE